MPDDNSQGQWPTPNGQPDATPVAPVPSPASQPAKKSKRGLMVVVAVTVVLLAAIGTITSLLLTAPKTPTKPPTTAEILTTLGGSFKSSLRNAASSSALVYKTTNPATVLYRFDSKNWVTVDKDSTVLTFSSNRTATSDNKSDYNNTIHYLSAHGYTETPTADSNLSSYSETKPSVRYYSSKDMVCNLTNTPETVLNGGKDPQPISYALRLDCAQLSAFTANINTVKPFAAVYSDSTIKDPVFGTPSVQAGGTKDYKNAKLTVTTVEDPVNAVTAEFYQTKDGQWHFFKAATNPDKIACDDFNSDDLKKAFIGFSCWDTAKNTSSFVEQSQPTFQIVPGGVSDGK